MDHVTLYRGVSERFLKKSNNKLIAKGNLVELEITADSTEITADNTFVTVNPSLQNTAFLHNICSRKYPSTCISTTTDRDVAKKFALQYHQRNVEEYDNGYIFELIVPKKYCYSTHNKFSRNSNEREVLINLKDFNGVVPEEWIIKKEFILSEHL